MRNLLQVNIGGIWQYVFCMDQWSEVITTQEKRKALHGRDFDYFANKRADLEFRTVVS